MSLAVQPATARLQLVWSSHVSQCPSFPVGYADVCAHHGEIMQGVFYSTDGKLEHALVTLPCGLFRARARYRPVRMGPLTIEPHDRVRALRAGRLTLESLGHAGWGGHLRIESDVPLCWGCGSSTTDVLASIRAVANAFGRVLEPEWVARISVAAETASDSLMHGPDRAVLFAQRQGSVLVDLEGPLPPARVLGFNTAEDRRVETLGLPPIDYSAWEVEAFRPMLGLLQRSIEQQDPVLLGRVATASTLITQRHRPKPRMTEILHLADEVRALGVQIAHSGTVAGLLFEAGRVSVSRIEEARVRLSHLGLRSWEFSTQV